MMRLGFSRGNDFIPDPLWKWNVHQVIAMHVPDLAAPNAILDSSEAVLAGFHRFP
jgi:hypothetical protein